LIELAVFDLAGTTVHDDHAVVGCLVDALGAAGFTVAPEAANALMGIPKPLAVRQLAPEIDDSLADSVHEDFRRRMIAHYASSPEIREIEGTSEAFARLRAAGIRVAVDTGFDRSTVDVLLPRMGWSIDGSITSDEVERGRPYPDMVLALMARFGVEDPSLVAKIGDTPSDLGEGTAAGCGFVIGVTEGTHTFAQLVGHPHTHLVGSVRDVPSLVIA
jgi:phosphonatase-like hydrolase